MNSEIKPKTKNLKKIMDEATMNKKKIEEIHIRSRSLYLPGLVLRPGTIVIIVDSRGTVYKGVFLGYNSSFIGLTDKCENSFPEQFINIKRINVINILGECD